MKNSLRKRRSLPRENVGYFAINYNFSCRIFIDLSFFIILRFLLFLVWKENDFLSFPFIINGCVKFINSFVRIC